MDIIYEKIVDERKWPYKFRPFLINDAKWGFTPVSSFTVRNRHVGKRNPKRIFQLLEAALEAAHIYEENTLVIQPRNFRFLNGRIAGKGVHS